MREKFAAKFLQLQRPTVTVTKPRVDTRRRGVTSV